MSQSEAYPPPRIDELIDGLGQSKYIITFDLTRGYWQVPVSEKDRPKTAFKMPFGLYQFNVMPFGLQGPQQRFKGCWITWLMTVVHSQQFIWRT